MKNISLKLSDFKIDKDSLKSKIYCYETNITFLKSNVELVVYLQENEKEKLSHYIEIITQELNWLQNNMDSITEEIKNSNLVNLKNNYWIDENEKEITGEELINTITLLFIHMDLANNEITNMNLEYDDGDIFYGHRITVDLSNREIDSIDI